MPLINTGIQKSTTFLTSYCAVKYILANTKISSTWMTWLCLDLQIHPPLPLDRFSQRCNNNVFFPMLSHLQHHIIHRLKTTPDKNRNTYTRHTFGQVAASSNKGSYSWVPQKALMGILLNTTSVGWLPFCNEVLNGPRIFLDLFEAEKYAANL